MSSQTPNIGLTLPIGSEKVSRQIINENNTKIDAAVAGKAGKELLGYKEDGDTASQAIVDGSFVVWKGSLYKANGSISQGTAFSGSNLTAVTDGGFNDLKSSVDSLSESVAKLSANTDAISDCNAIAYTGIYKAVNSTLNTPASNLHYVIYHTTYATGEKTQIAVRTSDGVMYTRVYYNGAWTAWQDVNSAKSITWNSTTTNAYGEMVTNWNISKYRPVAFRVTVNSSLVHSDWAVTTGGDIIVIAYDRSTDAPLGNTTVDILMWYN